MPLQSPSILRKSPVSVTQLFTKNALCKKSHLPVVGQNVAALREFGQMAVDDTTVGSTPAKKDFALVSSNHGFGFR
jgi:hypothetical protein